MYLLSYRGPGSPGGISSALEALWSHPSSTTLGWWHVSSGNLLYSQAAGRPSMLMTLPADIVTRHYRFCNSFIWPLVHGFKNEVAYDEADCRAYFELQDLIAEQILHKTNKHVFVHDYQFAGVPMYVSNSTFFWHIPWPHPDEVDDSWKPFLQALAAKISGAQKIGFHTKEYARNFQLFLDGAIAENTNVIVAPLPIDSELWEARASEANSLPDAIQNLSLPFVLSVDRTDYTKGILQRLEAIDLFFESCPEKRGEVVFVHLSQRTRDGIQAFDQYWQKCRRKHDEVNARWSNESWAPSVWIEDTFDGNQLSKIYSHASALFVSSLRDGLNLTAKEFISCKRDGRGALILSDAAGVSHQLKPFCHSFDPRHPEGAAQTIRTALTASRDENNFRMQSMDQVIRAESLLEWAEMFATEQQKRQVLLLPAAR